jgi:hypothetical protein
METQSSLEHTTQYCRWGGNGLSITRSRDWMYLNVLLTIYSATGAAGAILYDRGFHRLALGLGVVALSACFIFWRMDIRSRGLIGFGEDLLDEALRRQQRPAGLNPVLRARERSGRGIRFKTAFGLTYAMGAGAVCALILIALPDGMGLRVYDLLAPYIRFSFI